MRCQRFPTALCSYEQQPCTRIFQNVSNIVCRIGKIQRHEDKAQRQGCLIETYPLDRVAQEYGYPIPLVEALPGQGSLPLCHAYTGFPPGIALPFRLEGIELAISRLVRRALDPQSKQSR